MERYPVLQMKLRSVDELVLDPRNAREHREEDLAVIEASLKRYGQRKNAVINEAGEMTAGNGMLEAMRRLGWNWIAVGPAPKKKEDERGYALVDNRSAELSRWHEENLGTEIAFLADVPEYGIEVLGELGFPHNEVEGYVRGESSPDVDDAPEPPKEPRAKLGDLWILGEHRLVCGDARDPKAWEKLLGENKARMVWTDPPYGVAIVGGNHSLTPEERRKKGGKEIQNDDLSPEGLRSFLAESLSRIKDHTIPGAAWYVCATSGDLFGEFAAVLGRENLGVWRHTLTWVKDRFVMGRADYHYRHESIFYGWTPGGPHYFVDERTHDTVFEIPRPAASEEHPTMKPVELVARCLRNSSKPKWLVVDPFGGSGTTLVACEQEGRVAALLELDPRYCDVIVTRWEKLTGKKARRVTKKAA